MATTWARLEPAVAGVAQGFVTAPAYVPPLPGYVPAPPGLGIQLDTGEWAQPLGRNMFLNDVDSTLRHIANSTSNQGCGLGVGGVSVNPVQSFAISRRVRAPMFSSIDEHAQELEREELAQQELLAREYEKDAAQEKEAKRKATEKAAKKQRSFRTS